jgi:hypothetical protein
MQQFFMAPNRFADTFMRISAGMEQGFSLANNSEISWEPILSVPYEKW